MDELLPKAALIELEKAQRKLLAGGDVKVKSSVGWLKKSLAWCDEHGIRLGRDAGAFFYIEHDGIGKVDAKLQAIGYSPLLHFQDGVTGDRCGATKVSPNEKDAKQLPTEHLVLTACSDLPLCLSYQSLLQLPETPTQIQMELDIRTLDLMSYDYLVVVENRDCFTAWHQYKIPCELTGALVVYRGHESHHTKACQTLKGRWLDEKGECGQVFFGDFDPHGMGLAIEATTPYQHLLLPDVNWLQVHHVSSHFDESKAYSKRNLHRRCPEQWHSLLHLMYPQQIALRQQWMFDTQLKLY